MKNDYRIMDISGILCFFDTPIIDFEISGVQLTKAIDLSGGKYFPCYFRELGLTYEAFNTFFNDRVVRRNAMDIWVYLRSMKMKQYDFNELIKKMNGWDALGTFWVKFSNMGATCWNEILTQKYPIY